MSTVVPITPDILRAAPAPIDNGTLLQEAGTHVIASRTVGEWTKDAQVWDTADTFGEAEEIARELKLRFADKNFGIFKLVAEIKPKDDPLETVRIQ